MFNLVTHTHKHINTNIPTSETNKRLLYSSSFKKEKEWFSSVRRCREKESPVNEPRRSFREVTVNVMQHLQRVAEEEHGDGQRSRGNDSNVYTSSSASLWRWCGWENTTHLRLTWSWRRSGRKINHSVSANTADITTQSWPISSLKRFVLQEYRRDWRQKTGVGARKEKKKCHFLSFFYIFFKRTSQLAARGDKTYRQRHRYVLGQSVALVSVSCVTMASVQTNSFYWDLCWFSQWLSLFLNASTSSFFSIFFKVSHQAVEGHCESLRQKVSSPVHHRVSVEGHEENLAAASGTHRRKEDLQEEQTETMPLNNRWTNPWLRGHKCDLAL